ncbi:zinc finger protein 567-like isoform X2 [Temnothorax curvispinosus]|uniref:Zinc finger protein 567-like isoform X2 n=1 Tax=Temnothorax curvispinosus TaxID=300111 RepID=A0A6J1RLK1_9HYME|nr:zinc finger protein 567-like isoform X2 [Temnothorax curvispinosus]
MRVHMHRHRSNSFACEICQNHLSSKEALEKHHKTAVHLHDYICDICHKKLKSKHMLRAHINSHLKRKFKCPKCPNVYKSKQSLNEHLLSKHKGIRKYECFICKKTYGHRSNLTRHQKVHSGSRIPPTAMS